MNVEELNALIEKCLSEISKASNQKYNSDHAERTAALFLETQVKLAFYLEDVELRAKMAKNDIERIEGEKYFEYKTSGSGDKKITENALTSAVAKDTDVHKAKNNSAKLDAEMRKFGFIMNTLRDSHIYFRTIGKAQQ